MLYFDSSALVKLARPEPGSESLVEWLKARGEDFRISSVIIEVEVARALRRSHPPGVALMPALMEKINRIELDQTIRATAGLYEMPTLRAFDAIHLATAQIMNSNSGIPVSAFLTYDRTLFRAAEAVGLPAFSPGQD